MIPATRGALLVGLLAPLVTAGCVSPNSVTCGDGRICPPESRCDEQRHRCITDAQMLPCVGHAENDGCTFANASGACRVGVCEPFFCGDGIVEALESCDGAPPAGKSCLDYGFDRGFLGCTATCEPSFEKCGSFPWATWSIPGGGNFTGVWASGAYDVYVVGTGILHWDGSRWSTAIPDHPFNDVWGSGPNDVFAVGPAVVAHWDGARWSTWDGSRWSTPPDGAGPAAGGGGGGPENGLLESVWGSGPDDVYAVGGEWKQDVGVWHWNGKSWSRVADPVFQTALELTSVWGTGPGDVFVAGHVPDSNGYLTDDGDYISAAIFHWDGSGWSVFTAGAVAVQFYGFAGTDPKDVFAVGSGPTAHWDGTSWSMMPGAAEPLTAAWAGGGEVFAVGSCGAVFKWDGGTWVAVQAGNAQCDIHTGGIYGTGGNVFAVGPGPTHARRDSSAWSAVTSGVSWSALWAGAADNAYAVSLEGISHWDGARWSTVWTSDGEPASLNAVWGSGATDVFAVGAAGLVLHWDGTAWSASTAGPEFACPGPGGGAGQPPAEPCPRRGDLVSIWGTAAADVFTVSSATFSGDGALVHWDGKTWSTLTKLSSSAVNDLWASGPNDVYMAGGLGSMLHWDGAAVSRVYTPDASCYFGVWGSGPNDVYAVGCPGKYAQWDGARWTTKVSSTGSGLSAVRGSGAGDLFAVGWNGGLFHLRSGDWEPIRVPANIHAVGLSVTPGRVFVVGSTGEVHLDRPSVTCVGSERDCNDGWDNDCDGLQDAADPDCAGKVSEQCADLVDDDADGKIDCDDPDCVDFPSCKGPRFEQCADFVDNDSDGKSDCDDPDCAQFPSCKQEPDVGGAGGAGGKGGVGGAPPPPGA
jgi:hypothetical protein